MLTFGRRKLRKKNQVSVSISSSRNDMIININNLSKRIKFVQNIQCIPGNSTKLSVSHYYAYWIFKSNLYLNFTIPLFI